MKTRIVDVTSDARSPAKAGVRRSRLAGAEAAGGLHAARRMDLIVSAASASLLPLAALVSLLVFGVAGWLVAFAGVFTMDGIVKLATGRSRTELLRARIVPELACGEDGRIALGRWVGALWLAVGVTSLLSARMAVPLPREPAPASLLLEWGMLTLFFVLTAVARAKKRHEHKEAVAC